MRPHALPRIAEGMEDRAETLNRACEMLREALGPHAEIPIAEILKEAIRSGIVLIERQSP